MKNWTLSCYIVALMILASCISREPRPQDLVQPWSQDLEAGEAPLPFVAKYRRDEKFVYYLAAKHGNKIQDDTFKLLNKVLSEYKADIFLLEGFESQKGYSPQDIKEWAKSDGDAGFFKGGEAAFATQLALQKKIPFRGIEPSDEEIYQALLKEKFTADDLIHYYFLRQVPQWKKAGTLNISAIKQTYKNFATGVAQKINVATVPTYMDFLKWYKQKNKEDFTIDNVDSEKSAPYYQGVYFTQKLSSVVGRVRDRHMVQVIENELKTKERVFVLVGGSHWMTQKRALEALSGYPSFEYKQY